MHGAYCSMPHSNQHAGHATLHACLHLPPACPDVPVVQALHRRGVGGEALSPRCWQVKDRNGIIVSYGANSPAQIDAAVKTMGEVLKASAGCS